MASPKAIASSVSGSPHVFVSYVRENNEQVDRLAATLARHGVVVWLDRESLKPGVHWRQAIRTAIQEGAFFIACFSAAYTARTRSYFNEELTIAVEEIRMRPTDRIWFIPVRLTECEIPNLEISRGRTLRDLQWVDLHVDWRRGIHRLVAAIGPTAKQKPARAPRADLRTLLRELPKLEREFRKIYPGVVTVELGRRVVAGRRTDRWCIRVCVTRKLHPSQLSQTQRLPNVFRELPVDIVEVGR